MSDQSEASIRTRDQSEVTISTPELTAMDGKLLVSNRLGTPRVLVAALEGTLVAPLTSELLQVLSLVRRNVLDEVPGAEIRMPVNIIIIINIIIITYYVYTFLVLVTRMHILTCGSVCPADCSCSCLPNKMPLRLIIILNTKVPCNWVIKSSTMIFSLSRPIVNSDDGIINLLSFMLWFGRIIFFEFNTYMFVILFH